MPDINKPLRVLMVMTSMDRGGAETFTMNMYRHMDRSLVQFDFLVHRPWEGAYEEEIRSLGGRIYRIRRQNPLDPSYWKDLANFLDGHRYAIVHAQLDCMSSLPLKSARERGVPVRIAHSHNSRQDKDLKYPLKMICKRDIKHEATDLFACGVDAGKWMFGTDDFTVVPNGIEVDSFAFNPNHRRDVRERLGIADNEIVIGHVGRFQPQKNHGFVLRTFHELHESLPESVLLLVGDGPLREEMEREARDLGCGGAVRFLGARADVPDLMQAMDVFFLPSLYEGLPLVLLEAQAAGLTCVISDTIPKDCDLSGSHLCRLSLKEQPPAVWAQALLRFSCERGDGRSRGAEIVRAAGFDATEVAKRLQTFYLDRYSEAQ